MGLKVNMQMDMNKLFDKFASLPDEKTPKLDIDARKEQQEKERKAAYDRLDKKGEKDEK